MTRQVILVVAVACSLGTGLAGCGAAPADVGPLADALRPIRERGVIIVCLLIEKAYKHRTTQSLNH